MYIADFDLKKEATGPTANVNGFEQIVKVSNVIYLVE